MENHRDKLKAALERLNIESENSGSSTGKRWIKNESGPSIDSYSPIDGKLIATVKSTSEAELEGIIQKSREGFKYWRTIAPPQRGEVIRQIGVKLREYKADLGLLVSFEMGKIYQEGLGEVQEMIDICDFATGLSRQLYGLTMTSERPLHRMMEQWHPLGVVGIISAFNFPVAVYSWNAFVAAVCGNAVVWKPSEKTPLSALAVQYLVGQVLRENNLPEGIFCLVSGGKPLGEHLSKDKRIDLLSATGSTQMGKAVARNVADRLGKSLLELGGNNALIISKHANLDMALRAVVFGAVGTCGQRCTSTRRLIIHEEIYEDFKNKLLSAYRQIKVGHAVDEGVLVGPIIDEAAKEQYLGAIEKIKQQGGKIIAGGQSVQAGEGLSDLYVAPTLAEISSHKDIVQQETFAPILYLMPYETMDEAIALQNNVPQGLSSAIFTDHLQEAELFLSYAGSDCGIANVNIGTSGAEIGGAFGGEKETGGGRESGSDAWKAYMRRQTNTINYGKNLPLAQGIKFDV